MRVLPREKVKTAFPGRVHAALIYLLHNKSPDYNFKWLFCVVEPGVLLGETEHYKSEKCQFVLFQNTLFQSLPKPWAKCYNLFSVPTFQLAQSYYY